MNIDISLRENPVIRLFIKLIDSVEEARDALRLFSISHNMTRIIEFCDKQIEQGKMGRFSGEVRFLKRIAEVKFLEVISSRIPRNDAPAADTGPVV